MPSKNNNHEVLEAINLAKQGRIDEARHLFENLLKKNKANTNALMLLAELNSKTGRLKQAEQNYKKVIQLAPNNIQAHISLAMLFHTKRSFYKAEELYKQANKLDKNMPVINFNLGLVLQEQGKIEEAQKRYQRAILLNPSYANAYSNLAYIQLQSNKLDKAIGNYKKALKHAPNIPEIFHNLGICLLKQGNADEAEKYQRKALQLKTNYPNAWGELGAIHLSRGDSNFAIVSYKRALVCDPKNIDALCGLAKSLLMRGLYDQAKGQIEQALAIAPNYTEAYLIQSQIFTSLGMLDKAIEACKYKLKQSPKEKSVLTMLASIYEKNNQTDKAYTYLKPLLSEPSPGIDAILCFASISTSINRVEDAIKIMENALKNSSRLQANHRRHLHFALGKAHDTQHNYDKAFNNYQLGNQLKQSNFNLSSFRHKVDSTIKVFDKDLLAKLSLKLSSTRPVFIVGMPRSGTSLVEQILSSHPQVFGAGELNNINDIAKRVARTTGSKKPYPECIKQAQQKDLSKFEKYYTDYLGGLDTDALRITDKMPTNYLHIGLIYLLFPNATIIHCIRDPLDTCLSCYFQDFGGDHPYVYDLKDLAFVYKEYLRIMHFWQSELEIPMYNVRYEELVENQEKISKELINYTGLEWDKHCMQFHKNERFIWTTSYDQVRQPMYKRSVARWKNYGQKLSQLMNALDISV